MVLKNYGKMKKKYGWIALIFLLLITTGFQKDDRIYWNSDQLLLWKDFKGKPDKISRNSAMAHTGIKTNFVYENGVLQATVASYFRKNKSWVKKHFLSSEEGLKHEQGHFDLTEIYARKMRKQLLDRTFTLDNFQKDFKKIYDKNVKELDKVQEQYDEETNHHINKEVQKQWNSKIENYFKELEDYNSTEMSLKITK